MVVMQVGGVDWSTLAYRIDDVCTIRVMTQIWSVPAELIMKSIGFPLKAVSVRSINSLKEEKEE